MHCTINKCFLFVSRDCSLKMPSKCDSSVEDIEDLIPSSGEAVLPDRSVGRGHVVPKVRKGRAVKPEEHSERVHADSIIPGKSLLPPTPPSHTYHR